MTPQEALGLIDQALGQIPTDRATHVRLQEAVRVLEREIVPSSSE